MVLSIVPKKTGDKELDVTTTKPHLFREFTELDADLQWLEAHDK